MRKTYFRPELDIVNVETEGILATSVQIFDGDGAPVIQDADDILAPELPDVTGLDF